MSVFLTRTDLSRTDLRLFLSNQDGYPQDAYSVRYTVSDWNGKPVSGNSLKAVRQSTGEYYVPWRANVKNGSYRITWEIQSDTTGPVQKKTENLYIIDRSDWSCAVPNGTLKESLIPPWGSNTFISGMKLNYGDLPLYLRSQNGCLRSAFAVYWTIYNRFGCAVSERTLAAPIVEGEYYADWLVSVTSGNYYIIWEFMEEPCSPLESVRMDFSVINPANPYIPYFTNCCIVNSCSSSCSSTCGVGRIYSSTLCMPCILPSSISYGFVPPIPFNPCCSIEVPRVIHLPSTVLPADGQPTEQAYFPIPTRVKSITFYIKYTRGADGGFPALKLFWGNGIEETQETVIDSVVGTVSSMEVSQNISLLDFYGPVPVNDEPVDFVIYVDIPGGSKTVRLKIAEKGVPLSPGTASITLTASS